MSDGYEVLFEQIRIGPVMAPNRFYQVPHCNGMGHLRPRADAATRGVKAQGGWGVISTQETEIHPSSDLSPYAENRLWDDRDIPANRLITDAIHAHGALAAIELAHNGNHATNLLTRARSLAPVDMSLDLISPRQAAQMDKSDIKELRRWHRQAARRAKAAGFDIIYAYAAHHMTIAHHFLLPQLNERMDEYGGSLENRVRLIRELIEETKEEVGESCAVAFRFAVDEMKGADGMQAHEEGRAVVELLADLPDLWDVNVSGWENDSVTSRFEQREGYQTSYIEFVKEVTDKPVVAVGRLSSPDLMTSLVKKGVLDFVGAARPSIADPYLPAKIKEGRIDEIRECIGCNICVASDNLGVPIRCTQNPTMGEEWRRGWHPELIRPMEKEGAALVIGAGPAGLECAMTLVKRGMNVTLAEAGSQLGGRAVREASLLGLNAWSRVADHRIYDLKRRANAQIYVQSHLDAAAVLEMDVSHVFVATGSSWRRDGVGRSNRAGISSDGSVPIVTPDDIMAGKGIETAGPVLIYDDDQIYMGGVLAQHLAAQGHEVDFVTPASLVSPWCEHTLEQARIQSDLIKHGAQLHLSQTLLRLENGQATLSCAFTGQESNLPCGAVLLVTERQRHSALFDQLSALQETGEAAFETLELMGDAYAPGLIADAVFSGHLAAQNFDKDQSDRDAEFFRREYIDLSVKM